MILTRHKHAPGARLDYPIDWSEWLNGDTIATSTWTKDTADPAMSIFTESQTDTATAVWLDGGTVGLVTTVTNYITTAAGRKNNQSMEVRCVVQ